MKVQTHFRVDESEQNEFKFILKKNGLTPNEAYKLFRQKTIENGGLPFEVSQPSLRLQNALKSKDYVEFNNADEGLKWLNDWLRIQASVWEKIQTSL